MDTVERRAASERGGARAKTAAALSYQSGFGSELATEALPGALPQGQNSPQRPPIAAHGCIACARRRRTVRSSRSTRAC